ncbi:MAG: TetR/AcrR family transcriptional regulator [Hyphomicrobiaceae bacterium]|nr:MAG: TetR/AcrR family transcriptional regulator [Hyphomicrobiaceae bacterium]
MPGKQRRSIGSAAPHKRGERRLAARGRAAASTEPEHAGSVKRVAGSPEPRAAKAKPVSRMRGRKVDAGARRKAILEAALAVFAEKGYEAARLDDVAAKAGVAKGTLYLYFRDKEALFESLIRSTVSPVIDSLARLAGAPDLSVSTVLDAAFAIFEKEVLATKRKLLLRLIIAEGPRFPALAEFYYREVVKRGLRLMRTVAERAVRNGEFPTDAAVRYPQLIVAPLVVAVIWEGLFGRIDPLDAGGMLQAHRAALMAKGVRDAP